MYLGGKKVWLVLALFLVLTIIVAVFRRQDAGEILVIQPLGAVVVAETLRTLAAMEAR